MNRKSRKLLRCGGRIKRRMLYSIVELKMRCGLLDITSIICIFILWKLEMQISLYRRCLYESQAQAKGKTHNKLRLTTIPQLLLIILKCAPWCISCISFSRYKISICIIINLFGWKFQFGIFAAVTVAVAFIFYRNLDIHLKSHKILCRRITAGYNFFYT